MKLYHMTSYRMFVNFWHVYSDIFSCINVVVYAYIVYLKELYSGKFVFIYFFF